MIHFVCDARFYFLKYISSMITRRLVRTYLAHGPMHRVWASSTLPFSTAQVVPSSTKVPPSTPQRQDGRRGTEVPGVISSHRKLKVEIGRELISEMEQVKVLLSTRQSMISLEEIQHSLDVARALQHQCCWHESDWIIQHLYDVAEFLPHSPDLDFEILKKLHREEKYAEILDFYYTYLCLHPVSIRKHEHMRIYLLDACVHQSNQEIGFMLIQEAMAEDNMNRATIEKVMEMLQVCIRLQTLLNTKTTGQESSSHHLVQYAVNLYQRAILTECDTPLLHEKFFHILVHSNQAPEMFNNINTLYDQDKVTTTMVSSLLQSFLELNQIEHAWVLYDLHCQSKLHREQGADPALHYQMIEMALSTPGNSGFEKALQIYEQLKEKLEQDKNLVSNMNLKTKQVIPANVFDTLIQAASLQLTQPHHHPSMSKGLQYGLYGIFSFGTGALTTTGLMSAMEGLMNPFMSGSLISLTIFGGLVQSMSLERKFHKGCQFLAQEYHSGRLMYLWEECLRNGHVASPVASKAMIRGIVHYPHLAYFNQAFPVSSSPTDSSTLLEENESKEHVHAAESTYFPSIAVEDMYALLQFLQDYAPARVIPFFRHLRQTQESELTKFETKTKTSSGASWQYRVDLSWVGNPKIAAQLIDRVYLHQLTNSRNDPPVKEIIFEHPEMVDIVRELRDCHSYWKSALYKGGGTFLGRNQIKLTKIALFNWKNHFVVSPASPGGRKDNSYE